MNLGQQIKIARKKKNLTQLELANRVDMCLAAISNIERGENDNPSLDTIIKLVAELREPIVMEYAGKAVSIIASSLKEAPVARQKVYRR